LGEDTAVRIHTDDDGRWGLLFDFSGDAGYAASSSSSDDDSVEFAVALP
jgi:hypothetical protein